MPRSLHPSFTAAYVGYLTTMLPRQPGMAEALPAGAADATRDLLAAAGFFPSWVERLLSKKSVATLVSSIETRTAPGQVLEVGLRRRLVEDETRLAIGQGVRQVLCLGAGFDTLGARLSPEFPQVTFWELDHPATGKVKARALAKLGWQRANHQLIHGDLRRHPLQSLMRASGWRSADPSIVIAEGLTMYLREETVLHLFDSVAEMARGSTLIFSYLLASAAGVPQLGHRPQLVRKVLALVGEPLTWACDTAQLRGLLRDRGLEPDPPGALDLSQRYLPPLGLAAQPLGVERCMVARL